MELEPLSPLVEALRSLANRGVLPTNLGTAELRKLGAGFHRQVFTSARTTQQDVLETYKEGVGKILNPQTVNERTEGLNVSELRQQMKELLQGLGYQPGEGERGTLKDLSSDARINLVINTNRDVMLGAGQFIQANDPAVLSAFPCQELIRVVATRRQRDWIIRFEFAAQEVGDVDALRVLAETGRMIARLDSPLWQALGDGAGGYTDTLGNPYPPFAFGSGMRTRKIGYQESVAFGFLKRGQTVQPSLPEDLSQLFSLS